MVDRFNSYAEISPSRTGVKIIAELTPDDHAALLELLGVNEDGKQRTRKTFTVGPHREIALDTARFYAVTDEPYGKPRSIRTVRLADAQWLLEVIGPQYQAKQRHSNGNGSSNEQDFNAETRLKPLDKSGSGYGYEFMQDCHARKLGYEEAVAAILEDEGKAGEWANRVDERQLRRAFENSGPNQRKAQRPASIIIQRARTRSVMRPKQWLWRGRLLRGAQEMLSGQPGLGKSENCRWIGSWWRGRPRDATGPMARPVLRP